MSVPTDIFTVHVHPLKVKQTILPPEAAFPPEEDQGDVFIQSMYHLAWLPWCLLSLLLSSLGTCLYVKNCSWAGSSLISQHRVSIILNSINTMYQYHCVDVLHACDVCIQIYVIVYSTVFVLD